MVDVNDFACHSLSHSRNQPKHESYYDHLVRSDIYNFLVHSQPYFIVIQTRAFCV